MKYAIISDIHGNLPALKAALSDAEKHGADMYLFLGDFYGILPWSNEVVEVIRDLKSVVAICGNHEEDLIDFQKQYKPDPNRSLYDLLYRCFSLLTQENRNYLAEFPKSADISDNGDIIHLAHSMKLFYRSPKIKLFHSDGFRAMMEAAPFTHEEYLHMGRDALLTNPDAHVEIHALPKGVYLLGHNHIQFNMEYGGKLFINPGSCGLAWDCDATAAYTLLERVDNNWTVTERRIEYDKELAITALQNPLFSSIYAEKWGRIIEMVIMTGKQYFK